MRSRPLVVRRHRRPLLRAVVALALGLVGVVVAPLPAQAATYSLTISTGADSNVSYSNGTYVPSADGAVVNVTELLNHLAAGPVTVGDSTSTSVITIASSVLSSSTNRFTLAAAGPILQSAPLSLSGPLSVQSLAEITLDNAGNDFGDAVTLSGGTVRVADQNDLALGDLAVGALDVTAGGALTLGNGTVNGTLTATSNRGITQATLGLTVAGTSSLNASTGAISLTDAGNDFVGAVTLTAGGTVTVADRADLTLGNLGVGALTALTGGALDLGSGQITGALTATAAGDITQSGALAVGGASDIDAGPGVITLTNAGNVFVDPVHLKNTGTSSSGMRSHTDLTVGSSAVGGDLLLRSDGSLSLESGASIVAGGSADVVADDQLVVPANAIVSTGGPLAFYAPRQDSVQVDPAASLNGASFTPGQEYVDTAREHWRVIYPDGTATPPYTFFYADHGQNIQFTSTPPPSALVGDRYTVSADSTSGLPVSITIDAAAQDVCSLDTSNQVTFTAPGTCLVDANQSGDADYLPATQVHQSIKVDPRPNPTGPTFPGPVTGVDSATSTDPSGSATAGQGCATATATGSGTLTVATYAADPVGAADFRAADLWFDVQTAPGSTFQQVQLRCALPPASEGNTLYWWDGSAWQLVSGQSYDPDTHSVATTLSATSSPSLDQLHGTVFAIGQRPVVTRVAGPNRVNTAIQVSKATYPSRSAGAVVLARQDLYPDALVGGPLASTRHAPLLLTPSSRLDQDVAAEIQRVLPSGHTVFLLGGHASLSPAVASKLTDMGFRVRRLGGANRYETAVIVASQLAHPQQVLLATGSGFPDALAASAAAAHLHAVVLLTHGRSMPAATRAWLSAHPALPVIAIGGPAAAAAPSATALIGHDRYATAALTAGRLFANPTVAGLASGETFPDALAAITQLGPSNAPLLLSPSKQLASSASQWLREHKAKMAGVTLYGGPAALADTVRAEVTDATEGIQP